MRTSDPEIRQQLSQRMDIYFQRLPVQPEVYNNLALALRDEAVEILHMSLQELLTVEGRTTKPYNILGLEEADKAPQFVCYKPIKAAQLIISLVGSIASTTTPLLLGLFAISAILAIADVRTVASPAECLIFWILYSTDGYRLDRISLNQQFCMKLACSPGVAAVDFPPALHALVRLGCIRDSEGILEIAERIFIPWRN